MSLGAVDSSHNGKNQLHSATDQSGAEGSANIAIKEQVEKDDDREDHVTYTYSVTSCYREDGLNEMNDLNDDHQPESPGLEGPESPRHN